MKEIIPVSLAVCALVATGCKAAKSNHTGLPAAVCNASAAPWQQGQQAFQDKTADWNLDAMHLNPEGQRISVADFDNDGWPDIIVRAVGVIPDNGPTDGGRSIWLLRNTHNKSFEDVTYSSGFATTRLAHEPAIGRPGDVVVWGDVDNNGSLDAYQGCETDVELADGGPAALGETSELVLNDGTGKFTLGPENSDERRTDGTDHPAGASFVDFDLDGNLDLWVPEYDYVPNANTDIPQQNLLYKGDGTGHFSNVVIQMGMLTQAWNPPSDFAALNGGMADTRSWSALGCDLNGDGFPELLAGSYGRSPNQLWQNAGGTMFTNRSVASLYAYDTNYTYTDNQFYLCDCQANPTDNGCVSGLPAPEVVCTPPLNWDPSVDTEKYRLGGNNATAVCADIDNDGNFDLVNTDIKHWWAGSGSDEAELLINSASSDVTFTRPGRDSMGIVVPHGVPPVLDWDEGIMTAAVFDFDNDGWPDLYLGASDYPGNRGLLYHQKSKLQFESVPITQGVDLHRSHGIVAADFNRDGHLDLVIGTSSARCSQTSYPDTDTPCYPTFNVHFFENVGPVGNWMELRLEGAPGTNRSAIGALVTVTAGGVTQSHQVDGGHGHFGMQDDLVQHFGLGTACEATVSVRWPNTKLETQTFTVPSGYRFYVKEGSAPVVDPWK